MFRPTRHKRINYNGHAPRHCSPQAMYKKAVQFWHYSPSKFFFLFISFFNSSPDFGVFFFVVLLFSCKHLTVV